MYVHVHVSAADSVSSGSWFIVFNVLTLTLTTLLHQKKFGLGLNSVSDFSKTGTRAPVSAQRTSSLPA